MSLGGYLVGVLFALGALVPAAAAAAVVVARRARGFPWPVAGAGWGLLTLTGVYLAHLIPGVLGVLSRESVCAASVGLLGAALLVPRAADRADERPSEPEERPGPSWAIGVGVLGVTGAYLLALAFTRAGEFPVSPDTVTFHLPNVARWIQTGSFWQIDDFVPNRAPGNYPQTGDVLHLAAVLPWRRDFLMPLANQPLLALTALAVYCSARELRAPAPTAMLVAGATLAMPVVGYLAWTGLADHAMYATFATGVLFLLRHARTRDSFDLVLGAAGLGVAFGTRWYAVSAVAAVAVVWVAATVVPRMGRRRAGRTIGLAALVAAPLGAFWLVRNWVESGNPVFPVRVEVGGVVLFDAPHDRFRELHGQALVDYAGDPEVWSDVLWPTFVDLLALVAPLLLAGAAAAAILALARMRAGRPDDAGRVVALAVAAGLVSLTYAITPYSAAGDEGNPYDGWLSARYLVPALLLAAPATAWLISRAGRLRFPLELILGLAALDGLRRSLDLPSSDVALGALLLAAACLAAIVLLHRTPRRLAALAALGAAAAFVVGAVRHDDYSDNWYRGFNPVTDYLREHAAKDARIGIVGDGFSNYPLFGVELDNDVEFIGQRVDEMLRPLGERPGFTRRLRDRDYDYVYVHRLDTLDPSVPRRQERWLREEGYRPVATGVHPVLGTELALYAP